jgi:hypothetical protein
MSIALLYGQRTGLFIWPIQNKMKRSGHFFLESKTFLYFLVGFVGWGELDEGENSFIPLVQLSIRNLMFRLQGLLKVFHPTFQHYGWA